VTHISGSGDVRDGAKGASLAARAQRVLDGTQTGQYTKRMLAHDLLAVIKIADYWHLFMLDAQHKWLDADEAAVYGHAAGWCNAGGYDCAICEIVERQREVLCG
jgi:hypothetical protein